MKKDTVKNIKPVKPETTGINLDEFRKTGETILKEREYVMNRIKEIDAVIRETEPRKTARTKKEAIAA